jgi:hypothetical protein
LYICKNLISESMIDNIKCKEVLNLYAELMRTRNRNLREQTYIGIVELFIKNGNLNHASYFLCQMDRIKINIPRKLLDMFLDYSINNKFFEKENQNMYEPKGFNRKTNQTNSNKFDPYSSKDNNPEFEYYFKNKNNYETRIEDIEKVYKKLRLDAKPFIPKKISESSVNNNNNPLKNIDPSKVKEYVPRSNRAEN